MKAWRERKKVPAKEKLFAATLVASLNRDKKDDKNFIGSV
jgi:hypothetical protein